MNFSKLSGFVFLAIGLSYLGLTWQMDMASIGSPWAPKVFPLGLSILMIIVSLMNIFQHRRQRMVLEGEEIRINDQFRFIAKIVGLCVVYIFILEHLGYLASTILFMISVLVVFNGKQKMKQNIIVAVVFAVFIQFLFSYLLGIHLPGFELF